MALATVSQPKMFFTKIILLFVLFLPLYILCFWVNRANTNINIYLAVATDRQSNSFFLKIGRWFFKLLQYMIFLSSTALSGSLIWVIIRYMIWSGIEFSREFMMAWSPSSNIYQENNIRPWTDRKTDQPTFSHYTCDNWIWAGSEQLLHSIILLVHLLQLGNQI